MTDVLVDALRDVHDSPFFPRVSTAASLAEQLDSLAELLLYESEAGWLPSVRRDLFLSHERVDIGDLVPLSEWGNRALYALDLAANPHRVGIHDWDFRVNHFPLRPGLRGVTWSRDSGYEVSEEEDLLGWWSDEDDEDVAEREEFLCKQRSLDRNIDTFVALYKARGECDPIPQSNLPWPYREAHTDSDSSDGTGWTDAVFI